MASFLVCLPPTRSSCPSLSFLQSTSLVRGREPFSLQHQAGSLKSRRSTVLATATDNLEGSLAPSPSSDSFPSRRKKSKILPKKQQVMLRFLWMEKNIGIALDHVIPGHGTVPLSPYYFWPRKDAWEEIKSKLESKKWISRKQTILLLNQATDIINLWQQNATG